MNEGLCKAAKPEDNIPRASKIDTKNWHPDKGRFYSLNQFIKDDDIHDILQTQEGLGPKWAKENPVAAKMFFHPDSPVLPSWADEYGYEMPVFNEGNPEVPQEEDLESAKLEPLEDSEISKYL